jgi:hypothetical protein
MGRENVQGIELPVIGTNHQYFSIDLGGGEYLNLKLNALDYKCKTDKNVVITCEKIKYKKSEK